MTAPLDNDLAGWIDRALVLPGVVSPERFEDAFVAIVTSAAPDPEEAWLAFYRNTLDALHGEPVPGGTNAQTQPVHERAAELAVGDVLELGCCFGFLSLRLAAAGHRVVATDLAPGTVGLLGRIAPRLGLPVRTLPADARAVPLPDGAVDTVLAVHLLEHLPAEEGKAVVAEAVRLARRRVVVAVPFETTPNETWGHVTIVDEQVLRALGEDTGLPFTVTRHHGGWLVIDRCSDELGDPQVGHDQLELADLEDLGAELGRGAGPHPHRAVTGGGHGLLAVEREGRGAQPLGPVHHEARAAEAGRLFHLGHDLGAEHPLAVGHPVGVHAQPADPGTGARRAAVVAVQVGDLPLLDL